MTAAREVKVLKRVLGAAASGFMLAALFPKFNLWWLSWVALVPLLLVARASRPRAAFGYGWLAGGIFFAILVEWIRLFDQTGWALAAIISGAYLAAFAWLVRILAPQGSGWRGILAPPALWTALEWVRGLGSGGFTWGDLAYALHGQLPLVQLVSLTGPAGLTFLVVLVNAALAAFLVAPAGKSNDAWDRHRAVMPLLLACGTCLLVWTWGSYRITRPLPAGKSVRVAIIQGNVSGEGRDDPWGQDKIHRCVDTYLQLTRKAARTRPDVIFWPETAVPECLLYNQDVCGAISATAARLRVNLVVGSSHQDEWGHFYNSAFLFLRDGSIAGRYDKVHLVPYGEFTPWRKPLAFLYRYFPVRNMDYQRGRGFFPLHTDKAPLGVSICFESAFPGISRALRNSGAQVLAVLTNDAWFGYHSATWQHYDMSIFRAVENGSYLVRTATTGFSAILDPYGRTMARTSMFSRNMLVGAVGVAETKTLYQRVGDVWAWGCVLATFWLLFSEYRRRKRRSE